MKEEKNGINDPAILFSKWNEKSTPINMTCISLKLHIERQQKKK